MITNTAVLSQNFNMESDGESIVVIDELDCNVKIEFEDPDSEHDEEENNPPQSDASESDASQTSLILTTVNIY